MKKDKASNRPLIRDILIVEDEAIIGMALAADLEDLGFQIKEVVSSGEEALMLMQKEPADLLLLDIKLGNKMNGIETIKRIREFANPFVVIISGNSEAQTFHTIQDLEVDGFMVKPVNIRELQKLLQIIEQQAG